MGSTIKDATGVIGQKDVARFAADAFIGHATSFVF
jgi:hypothetical protein